MIRRPGAAFDMTQQDRDRNNSQTGRNPETGSTHPAATHLTGWEKAAFALCTAAAVFFFVCTVFRAVTTNITDDEAATALLYVDGLRLNDYHRLWEIFTTCRANNHWLNTILIRISTFLAGTIFSEAAFRMPAILSGGAYILLCIAALWKRNISPLCFIFLTCNFYLNEFMGLARGYGLANTFVFAAVLGYLRWRRAAPDKKGYDGRVLFLLLMLTLASAANTVCLLAYPSFGLLILYRLVKDQRLGPFLKRHFVGALLFAAMTALLLSYHLGASSRDPALYVGTEGFFRSCILTYTAMIVTNRGFQALLLAVLAVGTAVSLSVLLRDRSVWKTGAGAARFDLFVMLVIFAAVNLLSGVIFRKGYITGRVTVPFWSMVVCGFDGLFQDARQTVRHAAPSAKRKQIAGILEAAACAAVILLCLKKTSLTATSEWNWDYGTRERVEESVRETGSYPESEIRDFADVYYMAECGLDVSKYTDID